MVIDFKSVFVWGKMGWGVRPIKKQERSLWGNGNIFKDIYV